MTAPRRRTRIVCTIGPASDSTGMIEALLEAGMNVARLNFSHGDHDYHAGLIRRLREAADAGGRHLAILQDLQGPKIRVDGLDDAGLALEVGACVDLTGSASGAAPADDGTPLLTVSYPGFQADVQPGMTILLDDGHMSLEATATTAGRVRCRIVDGGHLRPRKGVNLPGAVLSVPALTDKDRADLEFGIAQGVDAVALSFVQRPEDVAEVKDRIAAAGSDIPVIAKIEKPQAVERFDAILEAADGIMIARGDLGVEMPPEEVPLIQKRLIRSAMEAGKPVITATQMLESMIDQPRPTRAEASDVANAVLDGTDAVMLSGETASGRHPLEAVRMMVRIVTLVERDAQPRWDLLIRDRERTYPIDLSLGYSACHAADMTRAAAIVCLTGSGYTARTVARFRPSTPLLIFTPSRSVCRRLSLVWGVQQIATGDFGDDLDAAVQAVLDTLVERELAASGDRVVITAGLPFGARMTTNTLRIETIDR